MRWRYHAPAWSPITGRMIVAAARGASAAPAALEELLRRSYPARAVVLTGSGTIALTLALGTRGPRPRVALPAWGCPDLLTAAIGADARIRLYDLDPTTLGPDLPSLGRAVADGIDLVVVATFFGVPIEIAPVASIVAAAGGLLIDDAAQGVGGQHAGRPLGGHGDLGVLSFGRGKGRTGGSGGALLANSAAGAEALSRVRSGMAPAGGGRRDALSLAAMAVLSNAWLYRLPASLPFLRLGETVFHPPPPLVAIRPSAAAALVAGWSKMEDAAKQRRDIGGWWTGALAGHPTVRPIAAPPADPGWLRFPVLVPAGLRSALDPLRQFGVMPGYPCRLDGWGDLGRNIEGGGRWPGADHLVATLVTLPTQPSVSDSDRRQILAALGSAGGGADRLAVP